MNSLLSLIPVDENNNNAKNMSQANLTMSDFSSNASLLTTTTTTTTTTIKEEHTDPGDILPDPVQSVADEQHSSLKIYFILLVMVFCLLMVHLIIKFKFHYLPESIAVVFLGAIIGLFMKLMQHFHLGNWTESEELNPTTFFLILLPPIIFESGYSLHKGNFFQNLGSILVFAIFGTVLSALVIGGGICLLGQAGIAFELSAVESFAFGSLISAVDPIATLAIFQALDIDPVLYMLVFGESILNDAVAIVLTTSIMSLTAPENADKSSEMLFLTGVGTFCLTFVASAALGFLFGLASAIILKHVDLRPTPSLELGMILVFSYLPYALAEGLQLSGIMAILFCGITMSHYTHHNLSPVTQITVQQVFRTMAFIGETSVFVYLGLAIFSFQHEFEASFTIWTIILCLVSRAVNIFPLSFMLNYFRDHKITPRMQLIMWFSGLRGAIAFALSLHIEVEHERRHVVITTTLILVLFTILMIGGSTMPLMKLVGSEHSKRKQKEVTFSKTEEMGATVEADHLSELTEEEYEVNFVKPNLKGFVKIDTKFLIPFFTRRFTTEELVHGRTHMRLLTNQWYSSVRGPSGSEDEDCEL